MQPDILIVDKKEFYKENVELYFVGEDNIPIGICLSIDKLYNSLFDKNTLPKDTNSVGFFMNEPTIQEQEKRTEYFTKIREQK